MTCCLCNGVLGKKTVDCPDGELCSACAQYAPVYEVALDGLEPVALAALEAWGKMPRVNPADREKHFAGVMVLLGMAARSPALKRRVLE